MEARFSAARVLSAGTLARVLNDNALLLAGREELADRLCAAWDQARQVIACDHCTLFSWPERELLALCEPGCAEAASDRLYRRLEQHARILDDEGARGRGGEGETGRREEGETGGWGEGARGREGDGGMGRADTDRVEDDLVLDLAAPPVSPSPPRPLAPSPPRPVSPSPRLPLAPSPELIASSNPTSSYLSLPLVGPEGMLGLMHLSRRGDQPFSIEEVVVLCVIASQFAACLAQHRYQEQLGRAAEARGRFISQVAHELRNALHPAHLNVRALQAVAGGEVRLQRPLERLETSVGRMARLVDDLLDTQRIVNGLVELHRERVDLNRIAAGVADNQRPAAEEKALSLRLEPSPDPVLVVGDPMRLDQVITNLVNNAVRYTDSGGVQVVVSRTDTEALVRVSDTGIGMDSETQAHVFELFRTQAAASEHGRGGLGIGLAVVKQLVGLHGGSASCFSAGPGQGSEFVVRLPSEE